MLGVHCAQVSQWCCAPCAFFPLNRIAGPSSWGHETFVKNSRRKRRKKKNEGHGRQTLDAWQLPAGNKTKMTCRPTNFTTTQLTPSACNLGLRCYKGNATITEGWYSIPDQEAVHPHVSWPDRGAGKQGADE